MVKVITNLFLLFTVIASAQSAGDYRSFSSGTWTTASNWERYNGSVWVNPAPSSPTSADGVITVLNNHTISIDAGGLTLDQIVINSGGQLTLSPTFSFTLANGTGIDLDNFGTFLNQGTVTWTGTQTIQSSGTYIHNTGGGSSAIAATTCSSGSTWIYRGSSSLSLGISLVGRTYHHLILESTSGSYSTTQFGSGVLTVNGDFTVGTGVTISNLMSGANTFAGNYTINGTITNGSGTQIFNLTGAGKTIGGSGTIQFENLTIGSSASYSLSSTIAVSSGFTAIINGSLDCGANTITGAGGLTISGTGTLKSGHTNGVTGNLTLSGTKTFSAGHKLEWNGSGAQSTGINTLSINTPSQFTVSNTGGTVTLDANVTFGNSASFITNSNTTFDAGTFTLGFGTSPTTNLAGVFKTANTNGFSGASNTTFTNTNTPIFTLTGSTIDYTSASSQLVTSRSDYNNLTLSGGGAKSTGGSITMTGVLKISNGETFIIGTNTITGTGGSASFSVTGTGTISLAAIGQLTGFSNDFAGTFYLTGSNPDVPSGTFGGLTVNGGGATMTGDVTITGTLSLNGPLNVGANTLTISNPIGNNPTNLTMGSTSSLVINGTAGSIHIPSSVTMLNNLTINNNQIVTADAGITINSSITLGASSGFLDMGANILEIGTGTSNTGALVRNGGSVRGIIKRWISATTGSRLFPIDNGSGAYSSADVNFIIAPSSSGSLTVTFHSSGSGSLPGGYLSTGPEMSNVNLINIAPQWWTITAGDGLSGGTYNLDISGDAIPNIGDINFIAIIKRINSGNPWTYNSGSYSATTGNLTNPILHFTGGTSFSDFGVGGNVDNLLPVELSSFTSTVAGRDVTLNWSTVEELNNQGFDVERKSTTGAWVKLGSVEGHGTVTTQQNYSFNDKNLNSGKFSYRLKQIDYNGNYHYYNLSNEVSIGTPSKYVLSQNFPNPFNPVTTISYEIPNAEFVTLKVYDLTGKEVANLVNEKQEAGFYSVKFDGAKLSSGIYFYTLKSNDFVTTKKLILLK